MGLAYVPRSPSGSQMMWPKLTKKRQNIKNIISPLFEDPSTGTYTAIQPLFSCEIILNEADESQECVRYIGSNVCLFSQMN